MTSEFDFDRAFDTGFSQREREKLNDVGSIEFLITRGLEARGVTWALDHDDHRMKLVLLKTALWQREIEQFGTIVSFDSRR